MRASGQGSSPLELYTTMILELEYMRKLEIFILFLWLNNLSHSLILMNVCFMKPKLLVNQELALDFTITV